VIGRDIKTDLALLKVTSRKPLPATRFGDSDHARVGDWVIAIGDPFGIGSTVTAGIVSSAHRTHAGRYDGFHQTDAPMQSAAIPAARCSTWTACHRHHDAEGVADRDHPVATRA